MAKNLKTLIRLHEWTVDQRRRDLGEMIAALTTLEAGLERLRREFEKEQRVCAREPEVAGFFYADYAKGAEQKRQRIVDGIAQMEEKLGKAQERLNEAYRELKKFEIAQRHRDTREARTRERQEQDMLNEIGLEAYRRRQA